MPDFNYTQDQFHIALLPNNDQAGEIYNQIWNELGGKIPLAMWSSIRSQIKKAGYTIRKAKPVSEKQLNELLNNDTLGLL